MPSTRRTPGTVPDYQSNNSTYQSDSRPKSPNSRQDASTAMTPNVSMHNKSTFITPLQSPSLSRQNTNISSGNGSRTDQLLIPMQGKARSPGRTPPGLNGKGSRDSLESQEYEDTPWASVADIAQELTPRGSNTSLEPSGRPSPTRGRSLTNAKNSSITQADADQLERVLTSLAKTQGSQTSCNGSSTSRK